MQHVGLRTEVQLRRLLLHIYMNTVDTAPYTLRGEERKLNGREKVRKREAGAERDEKVIEK